MLGSARLSIACVLRASKDYDAEYVARLRDGVAKHLSEPHRFFCLSDVDVPCERIPLQHDWPGWWSKMELFRPDIEGDLLYFDLDTLIVGDLSGIAEKRDLTMLEDFWSPGRLASGVMYLPGYERAEAYEEFVRDPDRHMHLHRGHGDGGYLMERFEGRAETWQEMTPDQIVSYKAHVRKPQHPTMERGNGTLPEDARVVCFHGLPRPRDVNWTI